MGRAFPVHLVPGALGLVWNPDPPAGDGPRHGKKYSWVLGWPWPPRALVPFLKSSLVENGSAYNMGTALAPLLTLENFAAGSWAPPGLALSLAGITLACCLLAWPASREGARRPAAALVAGAAFLPLALDWGFSLLVKPAYSDRAMLASAFCLLLLAAEGLQRLPPAWKAVATGLMALALGRVLWLYNFTAEYRRPDYQPAFQSIQRDWMKGDAIFHDGGRRPVALDRTGKPAGIRPAVFRGEVVKPQDAALGSCHRPVAAAFHAGAGVEALQRPANSRQKAGPAWRSPNRPV